MSVWVVKFGFVTDLDVSLTGCQFSALLARPYNTPATSLDVVKSGWPFCRSDMFWPFWTKALHMTIPTTIHCVATVQTFLSVTILPICVLPLGNYLLFLIRRKASVTFNVFSMNRNRVLWCLLYVGHCSPEYCCHTHLSVTTVVVWVSFHFSSLLFLYFLHVAGLFCTFRSHFALGFSVTL